MSHAGGASHSGTPWSFGRLRLTNRLSLFGVVKGNRNRVPLSRFYMTKKVKGIFLIAIATLIVLSCKDKSSPVPPPVITGFFPNSGISGSTVSVIGNNFMPQLPPPAAILTTTNTIKFNGTPAVISMIIQEQADEQRINTIVPVGATSGKVTVTVNGNTVTSPGDFIVTTPAYVSNVTVTTLADNTNFDTPRGVAVDAAGNVYVADVDRSKISKITPGGAVTTFAPANASFGVAVDAAGNVYVSDGSSHRILKITPNGTAGTLAGSNQGYADGPGTTAQFNLPWGVAVDAAGIVYVADALNNRIRKIAPDGTVSTLAGSTQGFADGQGANGLFNLPTGIAVDASGNVYVTDNGNYKIRKISGSGNVTTVAGSTVGYADGSAATAQFYSPYGVALDVNGNIYIGDDANNVIRKITPDGNVTTVAGSIYGYADGQGANAKFGNVKGVAVDAGGIIYAADSGNGRIRKVVIK